MMTQHRLRLVVPLLVLGASAWLGISEGLIATRTAATLGQQLATVAQLCYGVFALLSAVALVGRWESAHRLLLLWGASLVATAALAPMVWGVRDPLAAVLSGLLAMGVAAAVIWWARAPRVSRVAFPATQGIMVAAVRTPRR